MRFKINRNARSEPATLTAQKQLKRRRIKRWLLSSTLIIFSCGWLSLAGWPFSNGGPWAGATAQQSEMSPQALAQIDALMKEKESRTGAQRRMDSRLIYALKTRRGEMIAQLASVLRDQSRIIEDAMEHLKHLPAHFRRPFEQHAAQTQRMTPDQGAHSGRAAANYNHIVTHNSVIRSAIACGKAASRSISLPVAGWRKTRRAA